MGQLRARGTETEAASISRRVSMSLLRKRPSSSAVQRREPGPDDERCAGIPVRGGVHTFYTSCSSEACDLVAPSLARVNHVDTCGFVNA